MYKPLSLFIALRYVGSRHGKGFSSFISASSTIGIALGVAVLIIVLSAMNGFERELAQRLLSIVPHGEIIAVDGAVPNYQGFVEEAKQHPNVVAAAPVIKVSGMMVKGDKAKALELRGVDPLQELEVSAIGEFIVGGNWQAINNTNGVIIGAGIASKLGITVGDSVQILLPRQDAQRDLSAPISQTLTVSAIFSFGGIMDDGLAFMAMAQLAPLLQMVSPEGEISVHGIRIKVDDVFAAPAITRDVARKTYYAYLYDWTYSQGHLYSDIQLVRMVMFVVMLLVIAVASFNIVSTLIMAVNEKKGDIAILLTMGASSASIMAAFVFQGLINGVLGCFAGTAIGVLVSQKLTAIVKSIESALGRQFLAGDVYFIDFIPTELMQSDVVTTLIAALVLSLLATIYPAWRATKVQPANVLGQV